MTTIFVISIFVLFTARLYTQNAKYLRTVRGVGCYHAESPNVPAILRRAHTSVWIRINAAVGNSEISRRILCAAGGVYTGYIRSVPGNDIDLFFKGPNDLSVVRDHLLGCGFNLKRDTPLNTGLERKGVRIDLIKRYYSTPEEVLGSFDFTVCMLGSTACHIYMHEDAMSDICTNKLVLRRVDEPARAMRRVANYSRKGFDISYAELVKLRPWYSQLWYTCRKKVNRWFPDWSDYEPVSE